MFNYGSNCNQGYSLADIAAATGNGGYGNNNNCNDGWGNGVWIFILFILFICCGWGGNNGWGNNGRGTNATETISADLQRGFDQNTLVSNLGNITNAISNGFSNAEVSRCNAQANILQTLNNNQANITSQMNNIAMNQQECCCEQRQGIADLKYTIATEACADRAQVSDALKDVLASNTANTQAILDKLCQQEIETLKAQNQQLQMQNYIATLTASQVSQTGQILNDNANQTQNLLRALNPAPVPAYVVANPYGCNCNNGYNTGAYYGCGYANV